MLTKLTNEVKTLTNKEQYNCIFGGGAIRGIAYIGALKALDELGITLNTLSGSSVGAIFAGLIAVGYSYKEIEQNFLNINYDLFRDIHFGFGSAFALSKGEVFLEWIREVIEQKYYGNAYKKGKNPTVKFKDLEKDLVIITTDLTNFQCKEFSKSETPDFEIATAIRISSSMPGLMTAVKYENSELVDGDLQKSCPMWKLSNTLNNSKERILEFRLEGDYDKNGKNPIDYLNTVYSCVTSIATKNIVQTYGNCDKYDYVTINTGDVLIMNLNIPLEKRKELISIGYNQTMQYFKNDLPIKKQNLASKYKNLKNTIDIIIEQVDKKKVQDAKIQLSELYAILCEIKSDIDDCFYQNIQNIRFRILNELKPSPLFKKYSVEKIRSISEDFKQISDNLNDKINELKEYSKEMIV